LDSIAKDYIRSEVNNSDGAKFGPTKKFIIVVLRKDKTLTS
jgi:hypothetical protein